MIKHGGYDGEKQGQVIDFSVNINPLGLPEKLIERIRESFFNIVSYPEVNGSRARGVIARHLAFDYPELSKENIILGNGATELIYLFARALRPKKTLIIQPTFTEYERALRLLGSEIVYFQLSAANNFQIDEEKLLFKLKETKADLLVFCNPNNPTAVFTGYQRLEKVFAYLKKISANIFIDESFIDFTDQQSSASFLDKYPIFILKSMTKVYAIAGLRLGYALASSDLIARLNVFKEPWTVNSIALDIVEMLLKDKDYIARSKKYLRQEKAFMKAKLSTIKGLDVFDSSANFFLLSLKNQKASVLEEKLLMKDIYIRSCEDFPGLDDSYFRVAVKKHQENVHLIQSLKSIVK